MAFKYKPSFLRSILSITLILSSFVLKVICFTPLPRFAQTSALIGNNIYYMGGVVPQPQPAIISDFFYLSLSTLNSTDPGTLPWTELTGFDSLDARWGTAVAGGANNDLFVLFGGLMTPDDGNLVIVYDTKNNTWSKPVISASQGPPTKRKQTQAVVDSAGKMYIFGGSTGSEVNSPNLNLLNDMIILDTVNWSWSTGSTDGAPDARRDFSATILSNGVIVYIGGNNANNRYLPMSQINTYDTNSATWATAEATGDVPDPRGGHSAVLTSDGHIIIYGGAFLISADGIYTAANPYLAVLETTNNNFVWSKPKAGGTAPPPLIYHSASLVGNNMIVSFGNVTNKGPSSGVYVLDTKGNYNWVTSITPIAADSTSPNHSLSMGVIVGIAIGSLVGLILLGGGLFWFYRYNRNRKMMEGVIETPGEFTDAGFSRRYEAMNSTTTSQISFDFGKNSMSVESEPSREFQPTYSHNFPVQHDPVQHDPDPEIEDDKEFRILPQELQPEYLEKKYNI